MALFSATDLADMRALVADTFDRTFTIVRDTKAVSGYGGVTLTPVTVGTTTGRIERSESAPQHRGNENGTEQRRDETRHEVTLRLEWDSDVRDGDRLTSDLGTAYKVVGVSDPEVHQISLTVFVVTGTT